MIKFRISWQVAAAALAGIALGSAAVSAQTRLGPAPAGIPASAYPERRDAMLARIDSGVVVIPGQREPVAHYPDFRQTPEFRYLTGFLAPDATLVILKQGGHVTSTMFIEPPAPRTEFYTGTRIRPDGFMQQYGFGARSNEELNVVLDSLAGSHLPFYFVSDAESREFVQPDSLTFGRALARRLAAAHPGLEIKDATPIVDSLRAKKTPAEIALLKRAAAISDLGHEAVLKMAAPGMNEYELQATLEYNFRKNGGDRPGYSSIVGSGPNSTTLHYAIDDRVIHAGEVVVMDAATEYQGYSADVTRTIPISGKFTPDERVIYQIVRDAQAAGERQVKPGVPVAQEVDSINAVIRKGLTKLGLIDSADAVFDAPPGFCGRQDNVCRQSFLFLPHGPGHGIGLDVHDPAQWYTGQHQFGEGDAFTIEPGIYIRPSMIDVLPQTPRNQAYVARIRPLLQRYANIGVRIEDNYIVTGTGIERITSSPREIDEIEKAMARPKI